MNELSNSRAAELLAVCSRKILPAKEVAADALEGTNLIFQVASCCFCRKFWIAYELGVSCHVQFLEYAEVGLVLHGGGILAR